jgi:integrator complex subunit 2
MTLFSNEQILAVIDPTDQSKVNTNFTPKVLLVFYMLTVNNSSAIAESYGHDILGRAHIIEVVEFIKKHRSRLGSVYSQLLALIVEQLQHLFHLDVLLASAKTFPRLSSVSNASWLSDSAQILSTLQNPINDQKKTKLVLDYLAELKLEEFSKYEQPVIDMLPLLLDNDTTRYVLNSYENLWRIMCTRNPMELCLKTVNVLHPLDLTYEEIYTNIMALFGVDKRIFRVPPLLSIFLQVLNSYMIASRKFILSTKNIAKTMDTSVQNSYVLTQESTILQILLEICMPEEVIENGGLIQIRKMICSFIHQKFIENPLLAKLLHFQTYDPSLLPVTVKGIDSIRMYYLLIYISLTAMMFIRYLYGFSAGVIVTTSFRETGICCTIGIIFV